MESRIVTLINRASYRGGVARLLRMTPKYYVVQPICTYGNPERLSIASHILLEGERQDVLEKIREAMREYDQTRQEHDTDWEVALDEFRIVWKREHPFPVKPTLEEILKEFTKEGGKSDVGIETKIYSTKTG